MGAGGKATARTIAAAIGISLATVAPAPAERPVTIPAVRSWEADRGAFELARDTRVVVRRRDRGELRGEARMLARDLRRLFARRGAIKLVTRCRRGATTARRACRLGPGDVGLRLGAGDRELGTEGYRLAVDRSVRIAARADAGAYYGTRTLLQLLGRHRRIARGVSRDWPRYPERGLMVDVARKHFTPGWLEDRIRELAALKLNYLHLHLSDNQGFRIESETHPEVVSPEHLTKKEVSRIVALAARHHITVVPELDMPGHMAAALASHPELQLTDALGERAPRNLDVTNPAAREFARELIEEYLPLFPGPYWHGGADEYLKEADYPRYPRLLAFAQARYGAGANAKDAVHDFVNWMDALVRRHGKRLRIWHDDLEGGSAVTVSPQAVVEWWTNFSPASDPSPPTPQELLAAGHQVLNGGWFPTYYIVDHRPGAQPPRPDMRRAYEIWQVHDFYGSLFTDSYLHPPESVSPAEPRNLGSKLHVWNRDPAADTEQGIAAAIAPRLRVIAQKTWGTRLLTPSYDEFERIAAALDIN